MEQQKLKVEIWSDVMCPFCYIGKRRFENALQEFEHKDEVEIIWKSYQLDPSMKNNTGISLYHYLAERKGITLEQSAQMHDQMTAMASELGIVYNFDKAVIANSFDAHRLSHLAKASGLQDKLEEALFKAYFTEGKNVADYDTLLKIGTAVGLEAESVKQVLNGKQYAEEVKHDIYEANQIGVRGVPYFVLGDKYAVSGAQHSETFLGALNQTWQENQPVSIDGPVCGPDGNC
ncbi:DsbA family oxidoreductase [Mucilaginibacter paludis]|uniref:DSBA oxidoreductase n=1 Tax=Mucilaginibacter paludis DSM 18603 TaxID=714943 RepID=H1YB42_9SPHI|nr:DsbA family oxidoreductase [Mucilaginibacter paludis]EHQ30568.1 DSBA oxidoreductase [Mucilaginibacter paludis DSM 18603]